MRASTALLLTVATTAISIASVSVSVSAAETVPCTADSWEALNDAAVAAGVSDHRCWYLPYVTHWTSAPCEANAACISFFSAIVDKIPDCWYGSVSAKTAIEDAVEVCTGTTITTSSTSSSNQQTESASTAGDSTTAGSDNTPTTTTSNPSASDASTDTTSSAGSSSLRSTTSASAANGDSNSAGSGATVSFSVAALLIASQLALAL